MAAMLTERKVERRTDHEPKVSSRIGISAVTVTLSSIRHQRQTFTQFCTIRKQKIWRLRDFLYNLEGKKGEYDLFIKASYNVTLNLDRKSTRLNSSHSQISYAVFCLKK